MGWRARVKKYLAFALAGLLMADVVGSQMIKVSASGMVMLEGQVVDQDTGEGVDTANISVDMDAGSSYNGETNPDGSMEVEVVAGTGSLSISKENYGSHTQPVTIPADGLDVGPIYLSRNQYMLQWQTVPVGGEFVVEAPGHGASTVARGADVAFRYNWPIDMSIPSGFETRVSANGAGISPDGTGLYTVTAVDKDYTFQADMVDVEPPALADVELLPDTSGGSYAQKKTLTYTVSDNSQSAAWLPGAAVEVYLATEDVADSAALDALISADKARLASSPMDITENGTFYLVARDSARWISKQEISVANIDTQAPKISTPVRQETGYQQSARYTFAVSDLGSAVERVGWSRTQDQEENNLPLVASYTLTVDSNSPYYIYAIDKAGNKTQISLTDPQIDLNPPQIGSVNTQPTWDQSSNTVEIQVRDDKALSGLYYSSSDILDLAQATAIPVVSGREKYAFSVSQNGNYWIHAMDEAGNVSTSGPANVAKIDEAAPSIRPVHDFLDEASGEARWTAGNVQVRIAASDKQNDGVTEGSGVAVVLVSNSAGEEHSATVDASSAGFYVYTVEKEGVTNLAIKARDAVGRESAVSSINFKIDKSKPMVDSLKYVQEREKGFLFAWTRNAIKGLLFHDILHIEASFRDSLSGVKALEYKVVNKDENADEIPWIRKELDAPLSSGTFKFQVEVPGAKNFDGSVYLRALDSVGNASDVKIGDGEGNTLIWEQVGGENAPQWQLLLEGGEAYMPGQWTKESVDIRLSGGESVSGVHHYEYQELDGDREGQWKILPESSGALEVKAYDSVTPEDAVSRTGLHGDRLHITKDYNKKIRFKAISYAGETSEISDYVEIKVQKTPPANATVEMQSPNGKNGWYVGAYPEIGLERPVQGERQAKITTYYQLWNKDKGQKREAVDPVAFDGTNPPQILAEGRHGLRVWTEDEADNICEQIYEEEILVDITDPTGLDLSVAGQSILTPTAGVAVFDRFYPKAILVEAKAEYSVSGMAKLEYQKVRSLTQYNEQTGDWKPFPQDTGLHLEPNDKCVLFLRAEDMAGNVSISSSRGLILDEKPPVGHEAHAPEISIRASGGDVFYTGNVSVGIEVVDPGYEQQGATPGKGVFSGLSEIRYRIYAQDISVEESGVLLDVDEGNFGGSQLGEDGLMQAWKGSITVNASKFNSNQVMVEVKAVDNAGNERVSRISHSLRIDTTAPKISISYNNNNPDSDRYYKEDRTATIVVTERNFRAADVKWTITSTDGVIPAASAWTSANGGGNGDGNTHTATVVFAADGDYTLGVSYTDMAGLAAGAVTYASGTVNPTEFTIDKTLPEVSVAYDNNQVSQDRYFREARTATVTIREHNFDVNRVQFVHAAARGGQIPGISWSSAGDVHTATMRYAADGDYTFSMEMQDMAGNGASNIQYGGAAAQDFVIDTSIEKPVFSGVENGFSYKDEVVPGLQFSDPNFQEYTLTVSRTRMSEIEKDVSSQFAKGISTHSQGGGGELETFAKIQENDGIYKLEATVQDKAGNIDTESVIFSVNRYGSVYVFGDYLIGLQDQYVQAVDKDIEIVEYNPDKLVEGSVQLLLTRDGETLESVDMQVREEENALADSLERGWNAYTYTIPREAFAQDGVYKLAMASEDAAGNRPETSNYQDLDTVFYVDTTPVEIASITGMENSIVNAVEKQVDFEVFDAIGLEEVQVYVNGEVLVRYQEFDNPFHFSSSFRLAEGAGQTVRLVARDKAGNVTDTDAKDDKGKYTFAPSFGFSREMTISTNAFVRFYANKPLFWGTVGGTSASVALGLWFLRFRLR